MLADQDIDIGDTLIIIFPDTLFRNQKNSLTILLQSMFQIQKMVRENASDLLKSEIPSKKRSLRVVRKLKPMQKFHAQLLNELKNQEIKGESSSEEALLFDNVNNFIPPNEIGLGAVLLKPDGTSI
ncbi:GATA transcription factor [Trifolium pratense]|uniref:GATA transcription factor n=1 Tax=Trifolium pratense TaxID=57577 RepID=A0A2K3NIP0_TRIPR|nr:GATA transcription factor [Trifolium pratense]